MRWARVTFAAGGDVIERWHTLVRPDGDRDPGDNDKGSRSRALDTVSYTHLSLGWPGLVDPTLRCLLTHQRGAVAATSRTVGPTSKRTIVPNPKQEPWLRTLHAAVGDVTPEEPHPIEIARSASSAA